jgi:chemotaxis protein histidine kinase CheA
VYNLAHKAEISKKQSVYNQAQNADISKKQSVYNQAHKAEISKKQSVYNQAHKAEISKKQSVYNQAQNADISKKQSVYNQAQKAEIYKKQSVYNQAHKAEISKKQSVYDQAHKAEISKKQSVYDQAHKAEISKKQKKYDAQSKRVKNEFLVFSLKIQKFKNAIKWGPVFPCMCCHRLMFENGKKVVNRRKFEEKVWKKLFKDSINSAYAKVEQCVLCHTCNHSLIVRKKRPANSYNNGLKFDPVPLALQLTELEQQLIAKTLLFMKVRPLPRSRMDGIIDRVINVPLTDADVANTLASLPRTPDESFLCSVKLKRMQKLKNVHKEALIRPFMLEQALDELQRLGNPHYQNILRLARPDVDILPTIPESEEESSSDSDTDVDGAVNEAITSDVGTCMVPEAPEASVVINTTGMATTRNPNTANEVTLAPEEGKIPNNMR